jgi:hypothetical protein
MHFLEIEPGRLLLDEARLPGVLLDEARLPGVRFRHR